MQEDPEKRNLGSTSKFFITPHWEVSFDPETGKMVESVKTEEVKTKMGCGKKNKGKKRKK